MSPGRAGPRAVAVMIAAATMGCAGDGVIDLLPGEAPPAASSAPIASCSPAPPPKPAAPAPAMMPGKPGPALDPPCDGAPCPKPAMPSCIPDADVEASFAPAPGVGHPNPLLVLAASFSGGRTEPELPNVHRTHGCREYSISPQERESGPGPRPRALLPAAASYEDRASTCVHLASVCVGRRRAFLADRTRPTDD